MPLFPIVANQKFTYWWHHQILKKRRKIKKSRVMDVCEVHTEGQRKVVLHCAKVRLDGRRYKNRRILFSLVPGGKEKTSIFKISIFDFVSFPKCCIKKLHFEKLHEKLVLPLWFFIFLWYHPQGANSQTRKTLKNSQNSPQNPLYFHKNDALVLVRRYDVDSVIVNMHVKF